MRIAMVSEHASPLAVLGGVDAGGQNVHVAALARHLAEAGHRVVVHTRRDDARLPPRVAMAPGVVVNHVDAGPARPVPKDDLLPHMGAFADRLYDEWAAAAPDLVHAHFWMSGLAAVDAARPLGIPVVQTFHALGAVKRRHQGDKDTSPAARLEIERRLVRSADGIIATCSDEVGELAAQGADLERVRVVPCGVDVARFRPDGIAAARPVARRRRPRLLAVTRLVERKGLADAVVALGTLPDVELVIAGGPDAQDLDADPEARRLRRVALAHGVADRVRLLGRVERAGVPRLIRSADLVVSVPWYEPFGMVPVEAMACGVPVVASAVGGQLDTVVDGVTGLHVPPRRPDRLAGAVSFLLADDRRRRTMGRQGAARARRLYGWRRVAAGTASAYVALLSPEAVGAAR